MSFLNVALLTSAGVAAGTGAAQISAANSAQEGGPSERQLFTSIPRDITSSEVFAQLQQEIQAALGRDSQAGGAASPFDVIRQEIQQLPQFNAKTKRRALQALTTLETTGQEDKRVAQRNNLRTLMAQTSIPSLGALREASARFQADQESFASIFTPELRQRILQGRADNFGGIANLLSNFPSATDADIDALTASAGDRIARSVLERADVAGINPAGILKKTPDEALATALTLLGGQQQLAQTELGTRLAGVAGAQNPALSAAQLLASSFANTGQVAGQQSGNVLNFAANQARNDAALQTSAIGAIGGIGSDINSLLLLKSFQNQPGGGNKPPPIPSPF